MIALPLLLIHVVPMKTQQTERDAELARAAQSVQTNIALAAADPNRPQFHYHAPANWMNDPNGPIEYGGWMHVFYQFNPYGDHWGNMHWGHARSRDMVDWEDMPIALWPTKSQGEDHIYSGSSFPGPGPLGPNTPTAFYTSISEKRQPEQWSAVAEDHDLVHWHKTPQNPVLTSNLQEWRDPFLFKKNGSTYLITGGGENGRGIVALYKAQDASLLKWSQEGFLFHDPDSDVSNIECPNFAEVDGKWVLLISVHGRVEYFVGSLDDSMKFQTESRGVLADGSYASQLVHDAHGSVIHLAWVHTEDHHGWNGFMSLPSALHIDSAGNLTRNAIPAFHKLRKGTYSVSGVSVNGDLDIPHDALGDLVEIEATVQFRDAKKFSIQIRRSADGSRGQTLDYDATPGDLNLHLFVDRGVVDEYRDGGKETRVVQFSASPEDTGIRLSSTGGTAFVKSLKIHRLRPATFTTYSGK